MDLHNDHGHRLYLTAKERTLFFQTAKEKAPNKKARTFARLLAYTGCRISEGLELTSDRVDFSKGGVNFRTLKKRKINNYSKQHWRFVPLPMGFLDELDLIHQIKEAKTPFPLWNVVRMTGWTWIKNIMNEANIEGAHACPKGLRHAFAIACIEKNIPLPIIQKMLGHSNLETTSFYLQLVGAEEREFIERIWE